MNIMFFMLPIMAFVGVVLLVGFYCSVKSGQFEDLETQKYKIFFD